MKKLLAFALLMLTAAICTVVVSAAYTSPRLSDSLTLLQKVLNHTATAQDDQNGDGKADLLDVTYSLRQMVVTDTMPDSGAQLFAASGTVGIYNYCPSVMETEDGTRYIYYCTNRSAYRVVDYVGCRKGTKNADGSYTWSDETIVLSPSDNLWDSMHTCDPSVIRGSFTYGGTEYAYLMAYLGCTSTDNQENKIGLAVSNSPEGPFLRVDTKPLVDFVKDPTSTAFQWGVGQPSLVSMDKAGKVWLFYTRGDKNGTRTVVRECDLSDLDAPVLGSEIRVSVNGLVQLSGGTDILNNADFAYDADSNTFYAASDCHPNPASEPNYISSHFRVTSFTGTRFTAARWQYLSAVGSEETGFARNHNVGLVRDEYGHLPSRSYLTVYYTVSEEGANSLWTYRLHEWNVVK